MDEINLAGNSSKFLISDTKLNMQKSFNSLQELKNILQNLKEQQTCHISRNELDIINQHKNQIEEILKKYEIPSIKNEIQQKIHSRSKKRLRIRRKREKEKFLKEERIKNRLYLHKQIDNWRNDENKKMIKYKTKQNNFKCGGIINSGISKRIQEAKNYKNILESLIELRRVRKVAYQKNNSGELSFKNNINHLIKLWDKALSEYEEENKSFNASNKFVSNEQSWLEILFGRSEDNKQATMIEEKNLERFIEIRRTWDSCIVSSSNQFGSYIPTGWIIPQKTPSNPWSIYQNQNL